MKMLVRILKDFETFLVFDWLKVHGMIWEQIKID